MEREQMESNKELIELFEKVPQEKLLTIFNRHGVKPEEGVQYLVDEISLDGANTIASIFRGWKGISYDEIVKDVARKFNVHAEESTVEEIELEILEFVLQLTEKLSSREKQDVVKAVRGTTLNGMVLPLLRNKKIGNALIENSGIPYRKIIPTVLEIALLRIEFS